MTILIDANLLLRDLEESNPHCALARAALANLRRIGHEVVLVPQALYEF